MRRAGTFGSRTGEREKTRKHDEIHCSRLFVDSTRLLWFDRRDGLPKRKANKCVLLSVSFLSLAYIVSSCLPDVFSGPFRFHNDPIRRTAKASLRIREKEPDNSTLIRCFSFKKKKLPPSKKRIVLPSLPTALSYTHGRLDKYRGYVREIFNYIF